MLNENSKPFPWIANLRYDFVFFIGASFVGLVYGLFVNGHVTFATYGNFFIYLVFGLSHFGSTWSFYLDHSNRSYFQSRPWLFFYVPCLLVLVPVVLILSGQALLMMAITYWFSGFHVMKQSTGMTNLYRGRLGLKSPGDRRIDDLVILSASWFCLIGRTHNHHDFGYEFIFQSKPAFLLIGILLLFFTFCFIRWLWATRRRLQTYGTAAIPYILFTIASILLFTPFLFTRRFEDAFMANLFGHYCQYLGLVWLINRRKCVPANRASFQSLFLEKISQNTPLRIFVLIAYGVAVSVCAKIFPLFPAIGLTWAHFFVDRYLFRFRDSRIREAILPYLRRGNIHIYKTSFNFL